MVLSEMISGNVQSVVKSTWEERGRQNNYNDYDNIVEHRQLRS